MQKVSSCPLVKCQETGLWLPNKEKEVSYLSLGLNRRKFVQLAGIGAIGLTGSLVLDAYTPKKAEAGIFGLVPAFIKGIQILGGVLQGVDTAIRIADRFDLLATVRNEEEDEKEGNVGVTVESPIGGIAYQESDPIAPIPPRTQDTYLIQGVLPGPIGRNLVIVQTAYNDRDRGFVCVS